MPELSRALRIFDSQTAGEGGFPYPVSGLRRLLLCNLFQNICALPFFYALDFILIMPFNCSM